MFWNKAPAIRCQASGIVKNTSRPIPHTSSLAPRASLLILLLALFFAIPAAAADKLDKYDSAYVSTLNMTDEEAAELYGIDSTKLNQGPTLQELNEENPTYVKREYNHRQQVIVGSVVMLCVAVAMVLMNNYNPKR
jgi:hypothetical protein